MKRIAVFLDNAANHAIYNRISGLFDKAYSEELDIALSFFRSGGTWVFDQKYNIGEYNIFRLPDLDDFDGFVVAFNDYSGNLEDFIGNKACHDVIERIKATGKPAISLGVGFEGLHQITIDNYNSMLALLRHLMDSHRARNFWFIMGPQEHQDNAERVRAIKDYLRDWDGRDYSEYFYFESYFAACGEHGFARLFEKYGMLPDAIVCANDEIAVGVCMEAKRRGFTCPKDFLLTGFDNVSMASCHTPSLTTIDQNFIDMGRTCFDFFKASWAGEEFPQSTSVLTSLIRRQSCGCEDRSPEDGLELFNERIHEDLDFAGLNRVMIKLEYDLLLCDSLRDIGDTFAPVMPYLHCNKLYLVLDRRFFSERTQDELFNDSRHDKDSDGSFFLTEGYPPKMVIAFSCENGRVVSENRPVQEMFDELKGMPTPRDCMYLPLHFAERSVGFVAVSHCEHMLDNDHLSRAIQALMRSVENFYFRSRLKGANNLLSRASITDAMTGFYNRMGYQEVACAVFEERSKEKQDMTILFADMDGMKIFNDRYGHECGDQAIIAVAQALRRACPRDSVIARMGGDEFLVMLDETDKEEIEKMIGRIREEMPDTEAAAKLPYPPGISVGYIVSDHTTGRNLDEYVRMSDALMYEEKRRHKGETAQSGNM